MEIAAGATKLLAMGADLAQRGINVKAARQEGVTQRAFFDYNARVDEAQGKAALARRVQESQILRRRADRVQARNRAAGSPLHLMEENERNVKIDELRILSAGVVERGQFISSAKINRFQGKNAERIARRKVVAEIIGGVGDVAGGLGSAFSGGGFGG